MLRRLKVLVVFAVFALAAVGAGCGDDDGGDDYTSPLAGLRPDARPEILVDVGGKPVAGPGPPMTTHLTSRASGANGPFLYHWYFDDGTTGTEQNPAHTFNDAGVFNVVLDVRNLEGKAARRGAVVGVWPKQEWNFGTNPKLEGPSTAQIKVRQVRQQGRIRALHAREAGKLRAELQAEARAQSGGGSS